jgi:hypothetical protein
MTIENFSDMTEFVTTFSRQVLNGKTAPDVKIRCGNASPSFFIRVYQ